MTNEALNRKIATKIMRWKAVAPEYPDSLYFNEIKMYVKFEPATDFLAAFQVVERMQELDWCVEIRDFYRGIDTPRQHLWQVIFVQANDASGRAEGTLLPHAITMAALSAVHQKET